MSVSMMDQVLERDRDHWLTFEISAASRVFSRPNTQVRSVLAKLRGWKCDAGLRSLKMVTKQNTDRAKTSGRSRAARRVLKQQFILSCPSSTYDAPSNAAP